MRGAGSKRPTSAPLVKVSTGRNDAAATSKSAFASPTNAEDALSPTKGLDALKAEIQAKSNAAKEREQQIEAKKIADMLKQYMSQLGAQKVYQAQASRMVETERKKAKIARRRIAETKKQEAEFRRRMGIEKQKKAEALIQKNIEAEKLMLEKDRQIEEAKQRKLEEIHVKQERDAVVRAQKEEARLAKMIEEDSAKRETFNKSQEISKLTLERVLKKNKRVRMQSVKERAAKREVRKRRRVEILEQKESEMEQKRAQSLAHAEHAVKVKEGIDAKMREDLKKMVDAEDAHIQAARKRKVQQEVRRQKIRDRAYKISEGKIEEALHRKQSTKKTFCSQAGNRMDQKHRAVKQRLAQMAREKEEEIAQRRKHFQHKLQRAKSVVEFRREVADVRSREVAKQSLRKQQFFDVMEKLGRSHSGFEKLMALGYDLDNPDPKQLNIDNLMKLLKDDEH